MTKFNGSKNKPLFYPSGYIGPFKKIFLNKVIRFYNTALSRFVWSILDLGY